eukprot:gene6236-6473_t
MLQQIQEFNESPVFLLLNPVIDHARKDLPVEVYETVTAHLMGLHSAIKMLVGKLGVIKQQLDQLAFEGSSSLGDGPFPHAIMRQIGSLVSSLPALDNTSFRKEYLIEYNDTLATLLLAGLTQSLAGLAELTDKFGLAYEKTGRRGRGGAGSMMASSLYGL